MNKEFSKKTIVITGGARGIGLSTGQLFIESGANIIILDNDVKSGELAQLELGAQCLFVPTDITKATEIRNALSKGVEKFGFIHHLINNAGIIHYADVVTCEEEDWDRIMDVNLKSYYLTSKFTIPIMQKSGGGLIVNIGSAQSFISSANMVHYTTAKSALLGLTRAIAIDFGPSIRSLCICPGTVDTPMAREAWATAANPQQLHQESIDMHLLKRIAQPREIAELILFCCSNRCSFMTGQSIRVDGGLGISVPGSVEEKTH